MDLRSFGDPLAEGFGVGVEGGFGVDLNHGVAVGSDDLGVHAPLVVLGDAVGADGERATSAEGVEGDALGFDAEAGVGVVEEGDGLTDVGVAVVVDGVGGMAGLDGERSLAGGGTELVRGEALVDPLGALEAVEARGGEDEGVALAGGEFLEAGVDVASDFDESHVGAEGEELGSAAGAGGADGPPMGSVWSAQ